MDIITRRLMQYIASHAYTGGASYDAALGTAVIGQPWQVADAWKQLAVNALIVNRPPNVTRWYLTKRAHILLDRAFTKAGV